MHFDCAKKHQQNYDDHHSFTSQLFKLFHSIPSICMYQQCTWLEACDFMLEPKCLLQHQTGEKTKKNEKKQRARFRVFGPYPINIEYCVKWYGKNGLQQPTRKITEIRPKAYLANKVFPSDCL